MKLKPQSKSLRKGSSIAEMAVVCILFFMTLMGLFEYARLLFVLHQTQHAAREGARYAIVRTGGVTPANETAIKNQIINYTVGILGANVNQFSNFSCDVITVDMDQLNSPTTPTVVPKSGSSWHSAAFGQKMAVVIKGDYMPTSLGLLLMPSNLNIKIAAVMGSEAN